MQKVTAIVIGGELNGLGIVRSLARQGIPAIVVDTTHNKAALWSRYARPYIVRNFSGTEFIEDLIHLGKDFDQPPILLLTNEAAVHTVSENREELSHWFRFRLPEDKVVKLLSNKSSFHDFALQNGFPVPHSVVMRNLNDLGKLADLRFPCALKLDDKRFAIQTRGTRTVCVKSHQEAIEYASPFLLIAQGIIAQEWIDGPESNLYFTLFYRGLGGKLVSVFTGQKVLCSPKNVGNTAICRAAPEAHEELERMTLAFALCADFEGMGSMEYKWDNLYKKYVMVEPTVGRTDWQEEIATICGVNIPAAAYRHEVGLPVIPFSETAPTSVVWRSTFAQRMPHDLQGQGTQIIDGYFRWKDPLPALQYYCFHKTVSRIAQRWQKYFNAWFGNGEK